MVLQRLGDFGAAALRFSETLKIDPSNLIAAQRLSAIFSIGSLTYPGTLEQAGLRAALAMQGVDREPIAQATLALVFSDGVLAEAADIADAPELDDLVHELVLQRTATSLSNVVLLEALANGINRDQRIEKVLTTLRRTILLEVADQRFSDPQLQNFIFALIRQCHLNEFRLCRLRWRASAPCRDRCLAGTSVVGHV